VGVVRKGKAVLKIYKLLRNEKGATAIEYGLIGALIAVAAIGALTAVGDRIENTFASVGNSMNESSGS
jgi:pilus assembly protein Flp/PilA